MKLIKFVFKLVVFLVVLLVAALLTLPLWFGPVVKTAANSAVPGVVKTGFHLGHLSLNPYTARFELGGLVLANPEGYSEKYAVTIGDIAFDAETASLATDVIHIEEIRIKDVFVSYVSGGPEKVNNFRQIQYNVAGGREKYEAAEAAKKAEKAAAEGEKPAEKAAGSAGESAPKAQKKFIIDRLEISGLFVQFGYLPVKQPMPLVLKNIGRESQGLTLAEIGEMLWKQVLQSAGKVGEAAKASAALLGESAKSLEASARSLGESAKSLRDTAKNLGKGAGGSVKAVGEGATKAVGDGVKAVGESTKAAGESAKKALDSLKSLW